MDLILDFQGQRLEEQRASLSLLPDPGPAGLCGACSPDQPSQTTLDFYYMLIQYQVTLPCRSSRSSSCPSHSLLSLSLTGWRTRDVLFPTSRTFWLWFLKVRKTSYLWFSEFSPGGWTSKELRFGQTALAPPPAATTTTIITDEEQTGCLVWIMAF